MKILELVESEFSKLGICLRGKSTQRQPFNLRNAFVLVVLCIGTTSSCVQFFYIPKSFKEYSVSAYAVSAMLTITICYIGVVWNIPTISNYFEYFEKIINQSEPAFEFKFALTFHSNFINKRKCVYFRTWTSPSTNNVQTNQSHNWNGM